MVKVSYYKLQYSTTLYKLLCLLVQKCYESLMTVNIITNDRAMSISLDDLLWTYSKKKFIPHATNYDPLLEKQNILISDNISILNKTAKVVMFTNLNENLVYDSIKNMQNLESVVYLSNLEEGINSDRFDYIMSKSFSQNYKINYYLYKKDGTWESIYLQKEEV